MKKKLFRALNKLNQVILPSYTKKRLDLSKASKFQLAVVGWKTWVTKNALDQ
ncbi:MAG TPA: SsrA-binding protein [Flavobacteriaceae bacterium]|nr:SsrA-binding protein [Flavobacteriaceae bacterium]